MKVSSSKKILVLGATGLIGGALFSELRKRDADVVGTSRRKDERYTWFDSAIPGSIESFAWTEFDIVADCTGVINHQPTESAREANIAGNVQAPLRIIEQLGKEQQYWYCSTHAVLAPEPNRTSYAESKRLFEANVLHMSIKSPQVKIVRLPAVVSEQRTSGLVHLVKKHFVQKEKLQLSLHLAFWHIMYLPRIASVFSQLVLASPDERIITMGYPTETSIEKILKVAENTFEYKLPITFDSYVTDHYIPEVHDQQKYLQLTPKHFEEDLEAYFKK